MKTYNDFKQNIMEAEDTPLGGFARSAHSHFGAHRVDSPEQLNRINTAIYAHLQLEFQSKSEALIGLRHKLNMVGLDIPFNGKQDIPEGEYVLPVSRYGGTFGTSPTHNLLTQGFEITDGLPRPLVLRVNCEQLESGLYDISAKITPPSVIEEDVSEEVVEEETEEIVEEATERKGIKKADFSSAYRKSD